MDLRQLRYFASIVEQGSFSRAAEVLGVAQPALSLHVRNMEVDLGKELLFRTPKGVIPTDAGQLLLKHSRLILDQVAIAEDEVSGQDKEPSGEVRLGLPGTISQLLSVPLIIAAKKRYPKIKLCIAEAMSGFVHEWMQTGRVDLAVLYSTSTDPRIQCDALVEEELLFIAPPSGPMTAFLPDAGQPLPFDALARMPLILPSEGHGLRNVIAQRALADGVALDTVLEVDSYSNIKELVGAGIGCSVLPAHAVLAECRAGKLCSAPFGDPPLRRKVHFTTLIDRPMSRAVKVVRHLAIETLQDLVTSGEWTGAALLLPPAQTQKP